MGKLTSNDTLYLIVVKEVWDRIVSGDKVVEYREVTDYWRKRIGDRQYKYMRITNGYGNATRPYRLYRYAGATRVMKDNTQCYAIPIAEDLVIESRDYMESFSMSLFWFTFNFELSSNGMLEFLKLGTLIVCCIGIWDNGISCEFGESAL